MGGSEVIEYCKDWGLEKFKDWGLKNLKLRSNRRNNSQQCYAVCMELKVWTVWPVSNFVQQLPTTRNMQQGVQTDATSNIRFIL